MRFALTLALFIACNGCAKPPAELDDLGPLPPFRMTDDQGRTVTDATLRGTVWAANFLFTSCPTACPPLARATAALQPKIAPLTTAQAPVRLVSISVDPMTDSPAVLRTFGQKYAADPALWQLLTGDYAEMEKLVVQGFFQPIIRSDRLPGLPSEHTAIQQATPLDTAHSLRFVLVDQAGHMRALYGKEPAELDKLVVAIRWLLAHPPQ